MKICHSLFSSTALNGNDLVKGFNGVPILSLGRALSSTEIITIAVIAALVLVAIIFTGATCAVRRRSRKSEVLQPLLGETYPRYAEEKENTESV